MSKLGSRKLWAAVVGAVLTAFSSQLGLEPDQVEWIITLIVGYIAGQGIVDAAGAITRLRNPPPQ